MTRDDWLGSLIGLFIIVVISAAIAHLVIQDVKPKKDEPKPQRMMCVTLNHEKGGFLKTMVWDSHNMVIEPSGKVTSPEGFYNPFPGELCLVAPLINSRGPKQ